MFIVVVTGAAGFIGSHTCEQLLAAGHRVVGVDNFRTGKPENLAAALTHPGFELVEGDVSAPGVLDQIAGSFRPAAIVHLAALVSVQESIANPELNFQLNVMATQLVAEAARRHGARRIVFASSAAVYGDAEERPITERTETCPISPYGSAKLASEALLLGHAAAYGLIVRCQRYFNVYGPRQDPGSPYSGVISIFCAAGHARTAPTIFGDGEQTRDFISVHDVARANVIAATDPAIATGVANICTGAPTSINQLAATVRRFAPGAPAPQHQPARQGDIRHSVGAAGRAAKDLGFKAETKLETGLAELMRIA